MCYIWLRYSFIMCSTNVTETDGGKWMQTNKFQVLVHVLYSVFFCFRLNAPARPVGSKPEESRSIIVGEATFSDCFSCYTQWASSGFRSGPWTTLSCHHLPIAAAPLVSPLFSSFLSFSYSLHYCCYFQYRYQFLLCLKQKLETKQQ